MKKELIYVGLGIAISEIGGLVFEKIQNRQRKKTDNEIYEDQLKAYAMRNDVGIFDNDAGEAMKLAESLVNTREMENKEFRYIPKRGMSKYRFPLDDLTWAAWSWAF